MRINNNKHKVDKKTYPYRETATCHHKTYETQHPDTHKRHVYAAGEVSPIIGAIIRRDTPDNEHDDWQANKISEAIFLFHISPHVFFAIFSNFAKRYI